MAQRLMTRSPHIRAGSIAALAPLIRGGSRTISAPMLPPSITLPLVPTVNRRIQRPQSDPGTGSVEEDGSFGIGDARRDLH